MWEIKDKPLAGLKLGKKILLKSAKLLINHPEILVFFVLAIAVNTLIFLGFYAAMPKNYFPYALSSKNLLQIDPTITDYGDFFKNLFKGTISPQIFTVETLRSLCLFFFNTSIIVALGRYIKNIYSGKKTTTSQSLKLKPGLYKRIACWAIIYHTLFLIFTFALDKALSITPLHHLYYALSYTLVALMVFYINPIFSFEDEPLKKVIKDLFIMMNKTKMANISWVVIATIWFHFFGTPRTQIILEKITLLSGAMLFFKIIISPIAAIFWYWHIKLQDE